MDERLSIFEAEEKTVQALRERFKKWGIRRSVWDLDDTLVDTSTPFQLTINDVGSVLFAYQEKPRLTAEEFSFFYDQAIRDLREELGVRPRIMRKAVLLAAVKTGLYLRSPGVKSAYRRARRLREEDSFRAFPGARKTVELIKQAVEETLLTTHADPEWTQRKLIDSCLIDLFDRVACFDDLTSPKSSQWKTELSRLGVDPRECLVIGNNFVADIFAPVNELRVPLAIWINRAGARRHDVELKNTEIDLSILEERILEVSNIKEVILAILNPDTYRFNPGSLL